MKKKTFTKACALIMAAAMTATGCGSAAKETAAPTTAAPTAAATTAAESAAKPAKPDKMTTITVMMYDRGNEFSAGNSLTDNVMTRWVNEQMEPQGVHVEYVPVPRSGADNAVNLMLTGGTAPDIIRTYDRQRVSTYGKQGGLVDLAPYMDQLDPEFLTKHKDAIEFTQFDGHQYAIPGTYAYHGKAQESYLRKDLVEKMGMEMPTDREELIKVLYGMKENFPDIKPFGFAGKLTETYFTNFILSYCSRANERDNYIYEPTWTTILKPGHKEGLKQLNQFVLDGIISSDFAVDVDTTIYDEDLANGKIGFYTGAGDGISAFETADDPDYYMVSLDVLKNVDGSYEVPSQDALAHYVYVPKTAEDRIDAVVKYLAFLSNEQNAIEMAYGILGYGSDVIDGVPYGKTGQEQIDLGLNKSTFDFCILHANFDFEKDILVDKWCKSHPTLDRAIGENFYEYRYKSYYDRCLIPAALETDQYVPLLQSLIPEFVFKVMSAPEGKFEEVYEKEYQILLDNHLQEVLDERAAWYDANKK